MDANDFRNAVISASKYMAFFDKEVCAFAEPIEVENVKGKKKKVIPIIYIMDVTGYDEPKETVENDAYLHSCKCPTCGKSISRGYEEKIFYCEKCGTHLHQRAFTEEEYEKAKFEHEMDEYEDL